MKPARRAKGVLPHRSRRDRRKREEKTAQPLGLVLHTALHFQSMESGVLSTAASFVCFHQEHMPPRGASCRHEQLEEQKRSDLEKCVFV